MVAGTFMGRNVGVLKKTSASSEILGIQGLRTGSVRSAGARHGHWWAVGDR